MNDILRFASIGKACPLCHNEMELKIGYDLDGSHRSSIEWYCGIHSDHKGKPAYNLIAGLYFKSVSYDQLMEIGEMIRRKRSFCDLTDVEMELKIYVNEIGLSWASAVIKISKHCRIDIIDHVHNDAFDIGTWWGEVASKMPEKVIQHWLEHMPEDKKSRVVNEMRSTLEEEIQARKRIASGSIQQIGSTV